MNIRTIIDFHAVDEEAERRWSEEESRRLAESSFAWALRDSARRSRASRAALASRVGATANAPGPFVPDRGSGMVPLDAIVGMLECGRIEPLPALAKAHRESWIRAFRSLIEETGEPALPARAIGGSWYLEGGTAALVAFEFARWAGHVHARLVPADASPSAGSCRIADCASAAGEGPSRTRESAGGAGTVAAC